MNAEKQTTTHFLIMYVESWPYTSKMMSRSL